MRKFLFWPHLITGVLAGVVVLIMSVTGVLLMYEKQMIAWSDRAVNTVAVGGARLPLEKVVVEKAASVVLRNEPTAALAMTVGRKTVFVDPYTGRVTGEGSTETRDFFRKVTNWHRWLGENTPLTKGITGASNLGFLFLIVTGMYLWLPRQWSWQHLRPVVWFRGGLSGKARDFNWHNAIGIWCAVPLFFVVLTAVFFSYSWATPLLYRLTGEEAPAAPPRAKEAKGWEGIDGVWAQAQAQMPTWQTATLRMGDPVTVAMEGGSWGRVDLRTQLTFERETGKLVKTETFDSFATARRIRTWARTVHTGEAGGVVGQTIAGVVSLGGAVLVWTGLALSWRRLRAWRVRTKLARPTPAGL